MLVEKKKQRLELMNEEIEKRLERYGIFSTRETKYIEWDESTPANFRDHLLSLEKMEAFYSEELGGEFTEKIKRYMDYHRFLQADSIETEHRYTIDFDESWKKIVIDAACMWGSDILYDEEKIKEISAAIAKLGYEKELLEIEFVGKFGLELASKKLEELSERIYKKENKNSDFIEKDLNDRIQRTINDVRNLYSN